TYALLILCRRSSKLKHTLISHVEIKEDIMHVHMEMEQQIHTFPDFGLKTIKIHEYTEKLQMIFFLLVNI
ncbi:MAG TPA: hypothetical protein VFD03_11685, partial [Clostridia bacterium]|nr:hypothetical protein [Clostridia bacterium]